MEDELKQYSNDKLLKMQGNLHQNHETVKAEITSLIIIMEAIEKQFLLINEELQSRT